MCVIIRNKSPKQLKRKCKRENALNQATCFHYFVAISTDSERTDL